MRVKLWLSVLGALVVTACGTTERSTVVVPAGSTVVVPSGSDTKVVTPGS